MILVNSDCCEIAGPDDVYALHDLTCTSVVWHWDGVGGREHDVV